MLKPTFLLILLLLFACSKKEEPAAPTTRTYRMGFQNSAPRFDNLDLFVQSLNIWTQRADAAMITTEPPWAKLLNGESPVQYALDNYKGLVDFYRSKNLKLWIYLDPQNGLERTQDAAELVAAGKSIAQPEIQKMFRRFAIVMDSLYKPEHLGLALETNLIRLAASASIYNGVKKVANDAAAEIKARKSTAKLSVSVQADFAWGKLQGSTFQGIDKDFIDFPFIEELGISSYPYLAYDKPTDIPVDFYSRLVEGKNLPVFVSEGGWSSQSVTTPSRVFSSSPQAQADYLSHHATLLDRANATAVFQLLFTDVELTAIPPNVSPNIFLFTTIGMVDTQFQQKPALAIWDNVFARPLK